MRRLLHTGPAAAARHPGPVGEIVSDAQGDRVVGAEDSLGHRQQRGELVAGPGCIPHLPSPAGQVGAGGQGVRVLARA
jgi:hypothetical protein